MSDPLPLTKLSLVNLGRWYKADARSRRTITLTTGISGPEGAGLDRLVLNARKVKELGAWLDDKGSFGVHPHVRAIILVTLLDGLLPRDAAAVGQLARVMGPCVGDRIGWLEDDLHRFLARTDPYGEIPSPAAAGSPTARPAKRHCRQADRVTLIVQDLTERGYSLNHDVPQEVKDGIAEAWGCSAGYVNSILIKARKAAAGLPDPDTEPRPPRRPTRSDVLATPETARRVAEQLLARFRAERLMPAVLGFTYWFKRDPEGTCGVDIHLRGYHDVTVEWSRLEPTLKQMAAAGIQVLAHPPGIPRSNEPADGGVIPFEVQP